MLREFHSAEGGGAMTDPQLEGLNLAQRLAQGPLEPEKALDILEQLLTSLRASHDLGVIHGGISPRKIILAPGGRATLVGFPGRDPGAQPMARFAKGAAEPGYVAPEQIADDPVGPRADLYSVGVVAYAMLTGKDPFGASEGVAAADVYYRILYKPAPHVPEAALAGLPASVGPAIDRAMAKEPQARHADAKSFLQSLRADSALVPAAAPPSPKEVKREAEQQRREAEQRRREEEKKKREEERKRRDAEKLAALSLVAEKRGGRDLEKQKLAALKQEEKERNKRKKAAAAWGGASAASKGGGWSRKTLALVAGVIVLLLVIGLGVAYAMGGIGGSPETTIAAIETTTTQAAVVDDSTTTPPTEPVTTTTAAAVDDGTTTTVATTTTTLPPSSTTTTAKTTTTTAKPTTTTVKTSISGATIAAIPAQTYTGSAYAPSLTVTYGSKTLVKGTDYAVAYANNVNAGTATAKVTGKGSYTGSKSASFTIDKATPILDCPNRTVAYTGSDYYLTGTVSGVGSDGVLSDLSYGPYSAIGVYDVTVSYPGNGNYSSVPSQLRQLTIQ
jgi:serine/threonine-protein kinase